MVSAELKYRDYVGTWTIAIKFARISFNGDVPLMIKLI